MLRAAGDLFYGRVALGNFMAGTSRGDAPTLNNNRIPASRPLRRSSLGGLLDLLAPGLVGVLALRLRASNDGVATRPRLPRETRGLSCDHEDGVEARRHHDDAVDAT